MLDFKEALSKLMDGSVNSKEITELAKFLKVDGENDALRIKHRVTLEVLRHLLREDSENVNYQDLAMEFERKLLVVGKSSGYDCTFLGCDFKSKKHKDYLLHIKKSHFLSSNILCNYLRQCKQRFASLKDLEMHVSLHHARNKSSEPSNRPQQTLGENFQPCKCSMKSCGQKHFRTIRELKMHLTKVHSEEDRICIFKDCNTEFRKGYLARHHFRLKHSEPHQQSLKEENILLQSMTVNNDLNVSQNINEGGLIEENLDLGEDEVNDEEEYEEPSDGGAGDEDDERFRFLKSYADFLNRMQNMKMIPASTIQLMVTEFNILMEKALELSKARVASRLRQENVASHIIAKVMIEMSNNEIVKAYEELNTQFKREAFVKNNFKHTPSTEIILNPEGMRRGEKKESFQYISIIEGVKNLYEDPSFLEALELGVRDRENRQDDVLTEFCDGQLMKSIPYYQRRRNAAVGFLYSDAVELVNPLGSGRGRSKLIQMYWTVGDLPKQFRSRVDSINVAVVAQDSLFKKYGYKRMYAELVRDIKILENDGVMVSKPFPRRVFISFPIHVGDNLECHSLGGFSTCFSSKDICRCCHISHNELTSRIHDHTEQGRHDYWSCEEYDDITKDIQPSFQPAVPLTEDNLFDEIEEPPNDFLPLHVVDHDDDDEDNDAEQGTSSKLKFGIRERCCLNEIESFHAVYSFPLDILHDYFEGVCAEDLQSILKVLVCKGYFSTQDYNYQLKKHQFKGSEANDKPELIDLSKSKSKLRGKAMSICVHVRNFGLLIHSLNPRSEIFDEEVFALALQLSSLVELILAPTVRRYEVATLEEETIAYLNLRSKVFEENPDSFTKPKPKTHFMSHYWEATLLYGPMVNMWTSRFESKHRVGKMLATSGKNFKNISKLVAERQQQRQASIYYNKMFPTDEVELPLKVMTREDIQTNSPVLMKAKSFMNNEALLMDSITFKNQLFKVDDIVVIKAFNRSYLTVGCIQAIVYQDESVTFLVLKYEAHRHKLRFFEAFSQDPELEFVSAATLQDYRPLCKQGSHQRFLFNLHHHISIDPEN